VCRIETTEKAIRRFIENLGGPAGLSVCYQAGPGGFALWRLLTKLGVACDVVAPSLMPVRAGDRVNTDRRDAKKLVSLYRAGMVRFVHPPTPELEVELTDHLGGSSAGPRSSMAARLGSRLPTNGTGLVSDTRPRAGRGSWSTYLSSPGRRRARP
jgi:hypothetical protein